MKIKLNREMKIALLRAVKKGELDTLEIDEILREIRGKSEFLELIQAASVVEDREITVEVIDRRDQVRSE